MKKPNTRSKSACVLISGIVLLSACASTPKPTTEFALSKSALDQAVAAGGAEYAPLETKTARDKFEQAADAMKADKNAKAHDLAVEAAVDARLAEAKALTAKAEKQLADAEKSQDALRQEINRQSN